MVTPCDEGGRTIGGVVPNAYISGTGFYVPPTVVTNQTLVDDYGIDTSHEWILKRTGIEERRFSEAGVTTSDLGYEASLKAIESAGIDKSQIDLIIFCTLSPNHCFPGSGVYLQERLGLCDGDDATFVGALDIRNQCSAFLYGLNVANGLVRSGANKHVLLVGAETHSHALDLTTRGRSVSSLFGDGAGAVIVSATDEDRGIRTVNLGADGRFADVLRQRIWDMSKFPFVDLDEQGRGIIEPEFLWANMNGRLVFKHAVERMIGALATTCWEQQIGFEDIDLFFFHQANMRINQFIQQQLGVPDEKMLHNIQRYGNTTAATIPILMAEAQASGRLKPGMKVAAVAFGSGFTWGASIIDW